MTKSNASKVKPMEKKSNEAIPSMKVGYSLSGIDKTITNLVSSKGNSTARYFTFSTEGKTIDKYEAVCFHAIASHLQKPGGLGVAFQGYGGFDNGDRWRAATEADLYCNKTYPFIQADAGYYTKESLEWLKALLDPEGPFKTLLPLMYENTPEEVQARRAFIFPDVSLLPARLTWCFAIASRIGYANARVLWRYLHLLDRGLDRRTAVLVASGFEHEIKNGEVTGRIIKSYTGGFLGVDTTAYAGRYLSSDPVVDPPISQKCVGTYGSSEVFKSGKIDMKNTVFDSWEAAIEYTQRRGVDQSQDYKKAA